LKIFSFPFFNSIQKVEAFNSKDRNVMFDLNKERVVYPIHEEMNLFIPKNMKFYKFPENISESGKFGSYEVRFEKERNRVKVTRDISFVKTYIEPSEFEDFKRFYMNLINWDNQKSVLINR
jgi:hypothetical protein